MRTRPLGPLIEGAHAIDREYRVIRALNATDVPVPRVHGFCDDEAVIGRSFFIMDYVPGAIHVQADLPDVPHATRAQHFDAMNAALAQLHRVDPVSVGLADYGKAGGYLERQIRRWKRQYERSEEHTSELQSLMRISYAVFCLKTKKKKLQY